MGSKPNKQKQDTPTIVTSQPTEIAGGDMAEDDATEQKLGFTDSGLMQFEQELRAREEQQQNEAKQNEQEALKKAQREKELAAEQEKDWAAFENEQAEERAQMAELQNKIEGGVLTLGD